MTPPKFVGCSAIVAYSDAQPDDLTFEVVYVDDDGDLASDEFDAEDANRTFPPGADPEFSEDGVTGYEFVAGEGALDDAQTVVGLVTPDGVFDGYRNVFYNPGREVCDAPRDDVVAPGVPFDWTGGGVGQVDAGQVDAGQADAGVPLAGLASGLAGGLPLVGLFAAAGLVVHTGRRR